MLRMTGMLTRTDGSEEQRDDSKKPFGSREHDGHRQASPSDEGVGVGETDAARDPVRVVQRRQRGFHRIKCGQGDCGRVQHCEPGGARNVEMRDTPCRYAHVDAKYWSGGWF